MGCCFGSSNSRRNLPKDDDVLGRRNDVSCTDMVCSILFLVFIIGMLCITYYAYHNGDIRRVTNNHDCFGNICGKKNNEKIIPNNPNSGIDTSNLPFVFHTYKFWPFGRSLCVKMCPNETLNTYTDVKNYAIKSGSKLCDYSVAIDDIDAKNHKEGLSIAKHTYYKSACAIVPVKPQIDLLGFCIESKFINKFKITKLDQFKLKGDSAERVLDKLKPVVASIIRDFSVTYVQLFFLSLGSLVVSIFFIMLIRYLAYFMVYFIAFLSIVVPIGSSIFLWLMYANMKNFISVEFVEQLQFIVGDIFNTNSYFYMSIVSTVIAVIMFFVIIIMWPRLKLVARLFNEASNCMGEISSIMLVPVFTFPLLGAYLVYWFVTAGFLMSIGHPQINNVTECVEYETAKISRHMLFYYLVGLVWICEFIMGSQQMIIAGIVAQWYFIKKKTGKAVNCAVCKSCLRFWGQHVGSVVFGSLIITLVRLPRWFLMYMSKKIRKAQSQAGVPTCCVKCILTTCIGCLYCIEKCLQYINKNAYAIIAIEGTSFCPSAVRAFQLLTSNFLRVAALNSIGDFILLLGKLCISFLTAAAGMALFMKRTDLYFYPLQVLVLAFVGFFFAHCVLSIYETVLDVLLICICVDEEVEKYKGPIDENDSPRDSHLQMKKNFINANKELNKISGYPDDDKDAVEMQPAIA